MHFTLQPRTRYAMEVTFPNRSRHASPIWCMDVVPLKSGHGHIRLSFWQANYAQDKIYELRILGR